ncbi:hypothetical protein [Arthrobacter sp. FW306-2-2C-D06B]|uniref:hypothetical protein n=1 Tax=Arthrobacter sp. FW306-2-2C-D06B TaxID=2879618 RepID=UPI001F1FAA1F|nr:hypothetical protein [Arthrobacter sp. FW306-2-2C-D06B]UKA59814.1 hypothetical protein LFT47_05570 [Arthrobacter sp. FW306-2-2C-D06B]
MRETFLKTPRMRKFVRALFCSLTFPKDLVSWDLQHSSIRVRNVHGKKTVSGIDDLMAESNERWTVALRRSEGVQDIGLGEAVRTYYTRYFPVELALSVAVGAVIGALVFPDITGNAPALLGAGIALAAFSALIGGLIYNAKKVVPAAQSGKIDVLLSLDNDERKHVRRQIAGKAPLDTDHLPVIRAAAVQLRKNLATALLVQPMVPLFFIPQALNFAERGDSLFGWLMTIGTAVIVIGIGFFVRGFRRAGRFLTLTQEQSSTDDS